MRKLLLLLPLLLTACFAQRPAIPPGEIPLQAELNPRELSYGVQVLNQLSRQYQIDQNLENGRRVRKIVKKLADAAGGNAGGNPWHVYIFKDDNLKNAAATRGNYIFVWTGILHSTHSDDELATILAHEISHVLAKHTTPTPGEAVNKMTKSMSAEMARVALASQGYGGYAGLAGALTGLLVESFLINPGSQRLEIEADTVGLFLMAKAGYNPRAALDFWQRMKSDPSFRGMPIEFLSSHPSSEDRISNIRKYLKEANQLYSRNL